MLMRRAVGAVVALACVALLSSCSLIAGVPGTISDDSGQTANVVMGHIADAVNHHDAAALKELFSQRAREKAAGLDSGLAYFLSIFPSGITTWKSEGPPGSSEDDDYGKQAVELFAFYKVSAGGKEYDLYLGDFTVNSKDPNNVGIYSLGVAPYTTNTRTASGNPKPLFAWEHTGQPGVYVPKK
jgi:hypothetical protein